MVNFQQMPWAMLARILSAVELDTSLKGLAMFLRNVLVKVCCFGLLLC
jgi:hypothetical protein